ncbi:phosphopantothenoylcysteine decarboxylase [Brevipalpus obovatus]|uniref:phosphopantothenoylcysteine decarboxylase n=1 Tax=Brevipalpus obovatus TaxID=246614 RepID=UPI003D9DD502
MDIFSTETSKEKFNLLIGVTGSVAAIKVPLLTSKLQDLPVNIAIVPTKNSLHFFDPHSLTCGVNQIRVFTDEDEWSSWKKISDPVLHIELRKWADLFLISPLDANTMAKMAAGMCDNLLTCTVRAWDQSKPLFYCPAMNTHMWNHPSTNAATSKLDSWGYRMIPVVTKKLACNDFGPGAMAEVDTIFDVIKDFMYKE